MQGSSSSAGDSVTPASVAHTGPLGALAAEQRLPLPMRSSTITVSELVNIYMEHYAGRDRTRLQRLTFWVVKLGSTPMAMLTEDAVFTALEDLARQRGRYFAGKDADGRPVMKAKRKPLAPATLNRYQAALSAVLTWAQRRRIAPQGWVNPCRNLELKPEDNEVVRYLSDAERTALLSAARASTWSRLYLLVLTALTTGARRGELEGLRWGDIDLERGEAAVLRSKNGDRKTLVLVPAVVEELRKIESKKADLLVFHSTRRPDSSYNFDPAWTAAQKAAGIRSFRFHDLRHSCASALAQAGATLLEIADVLGHRQLSVTKRYSHLATDHKSRLVNRVLGGFK